MITSPAPITTPPVERVQQHLPLFVLGPADDAILQALFRYHYLTSQRICRLLYSKGSGSLVRSRMKRLVDAEYCIPVFLPSRVRGGSAPTVYTLARKGLNYLRDQDIDVHKRFRLIEKREVSYLFLTHTLAVNDFLMGAELLARQTPAVVVHELRHELDLKRQPLKVKLADGTQDSYTADGWLDFHLTTTTGRERVCIALELDRGSENVSKWRHKVRKILAASKGPYQELFGTAALTVAVVATPGQKRRDDLQRWTEAELTAAGEQREADLFRFTAAAPETEPPTLLLSPCWTRPFERKLRPLLEDVDHEPA